MSAIGPRRPTTTWSEDAADVALGLAYRAARLAVLTAAGAIAIAGGLVLADAAGRWLHPDEYPMSWEDPE